MDLKIPTKKDIDQSTRLLHLIELEIFGKKWVLIHEEGMITSPELSVKQHKELLDWAQQAAKQMPGGIKFSA